MKEASGELNMTVITIVAITAVGALLWLLWPNIQSAITNSWNAGCGEGQHPVVDAAGNRTCVNN